MNELPLKEELSKHFYGCSYSVCPNPTEDLIYIYKRDPYMYGPDVVCVFNKVSQKFLFEGHLYSINQFKRVLNLLTFL